MKGLLLVVLTIVGGGLYLLGLVWCFSENPPIFPGLVAGAGAMILLPALAHYLESRGSGRRFPRRRPKKREVIMALYPDKARPVLSFPVFEIHRVKETPSTWDVSLGPDPDDPWVSMDRNKFSTRPQIGSLLVVRPPEVIEYLGLPKKEETAGK